MKLLTYLIAFSALFCFSILLIFLSNNSGKEILSTNDIKSSEDIKTTSPTSALLPSQERVLVKLAAPLLKYNHTTDTSFGNEMVLFTKQTIVLLIMASIAAYIFLCPRKGTSITLFYYQGIINVLSIF